MIDCSSKSWGACSCRGLVLVLFQGSQQVGSCALLFMEASICGSAPGDHPEWACPTLPMPRITDCGLGCGSRRKMLMPHFSGVNRGFLWSGDGRGWGSRIPIGNYDILIFRSQTVPNSGDNAVVDSILKALNIEEEEDGSLALISVGQRPVN